MQKMIHAIIDARHVNKDAPQRRQAWMECVREFRGQSRERRKRRQVERVVVDRQESRQLFF